MTKGQGNVSAWSGKDKVVFPSIHREPSIDLDPSAESPQLPLPMEGWSSVKTICDQLLYSCTRADLGIFPLAP